MRFQSLIDQLECGFRNGSEVPDQTLLADGSHQLRLRFGIFGNAAVTFGHENLEIVNPFDARGQWANRHGGHEFVVIVARDDHAGPGHGGF